MKTGQFNPKEIGMEVCPDCNSDGRKKGEVCPRCGGFGFVIKREEVPREGTDKNAEEAETR